MEIGKDAVRITDRVADDVGPLNLRYTDPDRAGIIDGRNGGLERRVGECRHQGVGAVAVDPRKLPKPFAVEPKAKFPFRLIPETEPGSLAGPVRTLMPSCADATDGTATSAVAARKAARRPLVPHRPMIMLNAMPLRAARSVPADRHCLDSFLIESTSVS